MLVSSRVPATAAAKPKAKPKTPKVRPNADRIAHIAPRFPGLVREVRKYVAPEITEHELNALIEGSQIRRYKSGDTLFHEGEKSDGLYLIRKGRVAARTRDHTYVQQLVDAGKIREEAAENHPDRNRVMRCLGGPQAPEIDPAQSMALEKDDILLLCSDGLWGPLTQRQILIGLIGRDPALALPELISLAEARAGAQCDNISVVAMQWLEIESTTVSRE